MQKHEDAAITAAVLQGDINRYAELLDKYQENIYAIVGRRVPEIAVPGVTHEVFVQAYQSLKGYSGTVPFGNWAARIAIRSCCQYWRQRARHDNRMVCPELNGSHREWLEQAAVCKTTEEADHL
ncbi:MAG: sigma factor, partial [Victivallaceae bacterium]